MSIDIVAKRIVGETSLRLSDRGWSGKIAIVTPGAYVWDVPRPGTPWPFTADNLPSLKVISVDWQELSDANWKCIIEYSTDAEALDEEYFEASLDFGSRDVQKTIGWVWETAQTPVMNPIPTEESFDTYTINVKRNTPPYAVVREARGRLNDRVFHGHEPETMRFVGCHSREVQGFDRTLIRVSSDYVFEIYPRSAQLAYRAPIVDVDAEGNELFWQNKDATISTTYTTDTTKVGTPVYVAGVAGTPGLDKPLNMQDLDAALNPKPRYDLCDFADVLGLPTQIGDDEPGEPPPV